MRIVKISSKSIKTAVEMMKSGGVIACPTDTSYGLGCPFRSRRGIAKILKIKNRTDRKFVLIAASAEQVERFFQLNKWQKKLARQYWPGALSLIVSPLASLKLGRSGRFSVRVPSYKPARELARLVGEPIVATSANIAGAGDVYSASAVFQQFAAQKHQPDMILDGGRLKKVKPSTVARVSGDGKIKVLRSGPIKLSSRA